MKPFKILMLGDVVGQNSLAYLEKNLRNLRDRLGISFAVVNGENVAVGNGIDPESARRLFRAGADVITTGNHVFRRKEVKAYLDDEPHLLRPANYPPACYGTGHVITEADGLRVLVMNLLGTVYLDPLASPFEVADKILAENKGKYELAVVDFHAEATAEKIALLQRAEHHFADIEFGAAVGFKQSRNKVGGIVIVSKFVADDRTGMAVFLLEGFSQFAYIVPQIVQRQNFFRRVTVFCARSKC